VGWSPPRKATPTHRPHGWDPDVKLKWTCEECGKTGPFDDTALWNPHDCKSRGPFDEVSRLSIDAIEPTDPGPVEFDPPLTDAESAAYWAAINDDPEPTE
jgi:hypothetical protein